MQSVKRPVAAARSIAPEIPGYRLIAQLGSGGEGDVWMGERVSCKTRVALKIHRATHTQDAQGIERVRRGFRVLKALNCQGIARAIEEGETPSGELWLSTTLIEGRTLLEYVNQLDQAARKALGANRRWSFPTAAVLDVFQKVCECVQLAHRVGILHRDLKPSNVIVDSQGQPWLVDFGLARECVPAASPLVTIPGQFVGSVEYASPEQIDGSADQIDQRSDLYSLGVMLYQFLTGAFPYDVRGPLSQVFDRIRFDRPTPPRKLAPWIDRDLQDIVLKALEKRPDDRYATVEAFRDDLRRFVNGEPVQARQGGRAAAFARFVTRHRGLAATVAIVAALSITYSISVTVLLQRTRAAEANASTQAEAARNKFRMSQAILENVLSQVDENWKDRAGLSAVRRTVLQNVLTQLKTMLNERDDDPALQSDFARAHTKISDIALSLGQLDESEQHRVEALRIRRALADVSPDDVRRQMDLSIAIVLIGDVLKVRGKTAEAAAQYQAALKIDERVVAQHPDNSEALDNLAWSYERVGAIIEGGSDLIAQRDYFNKRHAICEKLIAAAPDNPERLFNLLASHMILANPGLNGREAAKAHQRACIPIADRLIAIAPDDERYVHYYIMTQWGAGRLALDEHDYTEGEAAFARALAQARRLQEREPDRVHFRQLLGNTLTGNAEVYLELGRPEEALRVALESVSQMKTCVELAPENPQTQFLLASTLATTWTALEQSPQQPPSTTTIELIRSAFKVLPPDYEPSTNSQVSERFRLCLARYGGN